jgi:ribosomal RNA assembly protein
MQHVYITKERIRSLSRDRKELARVGKLCGCSLNIDDDVVHVEGDAYNEFMAKNIIYAYGRGFDMADAERLMDDRNYFASIDLRQSFGSEKRIKQVKARVIGENGRTKKYIEQVTGAKVSVYGDTVSFIGSNEAVSEAETAVNALIEGRTHKTAYEKMEAAHRRNKAAAHDVRF